MSDINISPGSRVSILILTVSGVFAWLSSITPEGWIKALTITSLLLSIGYHMLGVRERVIKYRNHKIKANDRDHQEGI